MLHMYIKYTVDIDIYCVRRRGGCMDWSERARANDEQSGSGGRCNWICAPLFWSQLRCTPPHSDWLAGWLVGLYITSLFLYSETTRELTTTSCPCPERTGTEQIPCFWKVSFRKLSRNTFFAKLTAYYYHDCLPLPAWRPNGAWSDDCENQYEEG